MLYATAMSGTLLAAHLAGGHQTILVLTLISLIAGTLAAARKRPTGRQPTAPAHRQTGDTSSDATHSPSP